MSASGVTTVDASARAKLAAIADLMIPEAHGMPAASEVGVADTQLERVLSARPDLVEPLRHALDALPGAGEGSLDDVGRLETEDPGGHAALLTAIVGGYYIHPEVRAKLRYDGQVPREVWPEIIPNYVEEGLIDPVVERGEIFRPVEEEHEEAR